MSLWWAVTTLTTTGYGDAVPETALGRLIAGMVLISGLDVFGLWTGILATGFAAEHRRREFIRNWDLVTSVPFLRNLDAPAIIELTRMLRRWTWRSEASSCGKDAQATACISSRPARSKSASNRSPFVSAPVRFSARSHCSKADRAAPPSWRRCRRLF
jgi:hypothetical protein